MILDDIIAHKRTELEEQKQFRPLASIMESVERNRKYTMGFKNAIKRKPGESIHLIAEVKKASPSKGLIRPDFHPVDIACTYQSSHADAISVLTEQRFFQGSLDYLKQIRKAVSLPLLRKDFILDEYQLWEAKEAGADAILLIVAALSPKELSGLLHTAREQLSLDVLVEVHSREELEIALAADADIIGINNRDLSNFNVSLETTEILRPFVPSEIPVVSESGIRTHEDVVSMEMIEVDALLIGETFMRADDINLKIHELFKSKGKRS
jgi:indole-3-glycerol phosphate synthase